jgi:hypothetical protein
LGIFGLFFMGAILGPIAWILGNRALKLIDSGSADPFQRPTAKAGRNFGIAATVVSVGVMWYMYQLCVMLGWFMGGALGAVVPSEM